MCTELSEPSPKAKIFLSTWAPLGWCVLGTIIFFPLRCVVTTISCLWQVRLSLPRKTGVVDNVTHYTNARSFLCRESIHNRYVSLFVTIWDYWDFSQMLLTWSVPDAQQTCFEFQAKERQPELTFGQPDPHEEARPQDVSYWCILEPKIASGNVNCVWRSRNAWSKSRACLYTLLEVIRGLLSPVLRWKWTGGFRPWWWWSRLSRSIQRVRIGTKRFCVVGNICIFVTGIVTETQSYNPQKREHRRCNLSHLKCFVWIYPQISEKNGGKTSILFNALQNHPAIYSVMNPH